jgi:hypothetical protein
MGNIGNHPAERKSVTDGRLVNVATGELEEPQTGNEYYSPNQEDTEGASTLYRKYYSGTGSTNALVLLESNATFPGVQLHGNGGGSLLSASTGNSVGVGNYVDSTHNASLYYLGSAGLYLKRGTGYILAADTWSAWAEYTK